MCAFHAIVQVKVIDGHEARSGVPVVFLVARFFGFP